MENTYNADLVSEINAEFSEKIVEVAEKAISAAMDISSETERVMTMTPKDGYQKKIELISSADDLSTKEKIKAIDEAEDKYSRDLAANAEMCKGMMWAKTGFVLTCIAGSVLMVASPEGRKIAKSILKLVA